MARGGARPGAGRPAGSVAKLDKAAREAAIEGGQTPLEFLLDTMRNVSNEFGVRLDAAKAAAPYVHARLNAVTHSGDKDNPLQTIDRLEIVYVAPNAASSH